MAQRVEGLAAKPDDRPKFNSQVREVGEKGVICVITHLESGLGFSLQRHGFLRSFCYDGSNSTTRIKPWEAKVTDFMFPLPFQYPCNSLEPTNSRCWMAVRVETWQVQWVCPLACPCVAAGANKDGPAWGIMCFHSSNRHCFMVPRQPSRQSGRFPQLPEGIRHLLWIISAHWAVSVGHMHRWQEWAVTTRNLTSDQYKAYPSPHMCIQKKEHKRGPWTTGHQSCFLSLWYCYLLFLIWCMHTAISQAGWQTGHGHACTNAWF